MKCILKSHASLLLALLLVFGASPSTQAAPPAVTGIKDLQALQTRINALVKKVLPATVSLLSAKNGASGSGVIVSKDGLILTAGHVVRGSEEMTVIFPDGTQARAKVLGAYFTQDSAMLKIISEDGKKNNWPYAEIGHSKNLTTGDLVIALGHAGGFDPVRTPPVRFGRIIAHEPNKFITSDCTLIGGDSGGPLFDLNGRVVGIHSSIGTTLASNNHASIEGFRENWDKLKAGKTWGHLGGNSLLDNPDAPVLGIITDEFTRGGVGVRHVFEGGPADKAGLRAGDIIRSIDGHPIPNLRHLYTTISRYNSGDSIKVRITRGETNLVRTLILGRRGDVIPNQRP